MAAFLLIGAIAISFVVVRIGAAALELTGLSWERAKFQALSAFTNSGFTTRESEEIVRHPLRRRIISYLIILGNAGLVATIGSFAGTLMAPESGQIVINLLVVSAGVLLVLFIARRPGITLTLKERVRSALAKRYSMEMWSAEELLHLGHDYELTRFDIGATSPANGQTLRGLQLKQNQIQVLAVERRHVFHAVPRGDFMLQAGDSVVVYGQRQAVDRLLQPDEGQMLLDVEEAETKGRTPPRQDA